MGSIFIVIYCFQNIFISDTEWDYLAPPFWWRRFGAGDLAQGWFGASAYLFDCYNARRCCL